LKQITANAFITHFNLINLSNFTLFEFQNKLLDQLSNFSHLQEFTIEHNEFHLTDKFVKVLTSLNNLTSIKIATKKLDTNLLDHLSEVIANK